jgi:hypothetical protein
MRRGGERINKRGPPTNIARLHSFVLLFAATRDDVANQYAMPMLLAGCRSQSLPTAALWCFCIGHASLSERSEVRKTTSPSFDTKSPEAVLASLPGRAKHELL